jgi:hypothetical protein
MKSLRAILVIALLFTLSGFACADETIVFVRHGEKPAQGLGQLTCRGLNRALALPKALLGQFGTPAAVFAPNPGLRKEDEGVPYNYVRPLATIEPTAIQFGLPVNVDRGFKDTDGLRKDLLVPQYANATVFVAWEHHLAVVAARDLVKQFGGDPHVVPKWDGDDFDSIYVVHVIADKNGKQRVSFELKHEGLNGLPDTCPGV